MSAQMIKTKYHLCQLAKAASVSRSPATQPATTFLSLEKADAKPCRLSTWVGDIGIHRPRLCFAIFSVDSMAFSARRAFCLITAAITAQLGISKHEKKMEAMV